MPIQQNPNHYVQFNRVADFVRNNAVGIAVGAGLVLFCWAIWPSPIRTVVVEHYDPPSRYSTPPHVPRGLHPEKKALLDELLREYAQEQQRVPYQGDRDLDNYNIETGQVCPPGTTPAGRLGCLGTGTTTELKRDNSCPTGYRTSNGCFTP